MKDQIGFHSVLLPLLIRQYNKTKPLQTWITFDAPLLFTQCACLLDLKNGWQIISAKKSFAVYAATRTEKAEWMAHINKCIQDLLAKSENERFSY